MSEDQERRALEAVNDYFDSVGKLDMPIAEALPPHDWHLQQRRWAEAIESAERDQGYDVVLCRWAADEIEAGRPLPSEIGVYIARRLRDGKAPKARRRNDPANRMVVNGHTFNAVEICVQLGLPVRGNDERKRRGKTAVDIVAKVLRQRGIRTSRAAVRRVWDAFKRHN